jgi:hypothetical protein
MTRRRGRERVADRQGVHRRGRRPGSTGALDVGQEHLSERERGRLHTAFEVKDGEAHRARIGVVAHPNNEAATSWEPVSSVIRRRCN